MARLQHFPIPDAVLSLKLTKDDADSGYATSYPHLVAALKDRPIDAAGYVQAAHMVYGWMPTVLELTSPDKTRPFVAEAALLESARKGEELTTEQLALLSKSVNNSIVGASKLLHFVRPDRYAIWDSKVYTYLRSEDERDWSGPVYHSTVNNVDRYLPYMQALRAFVAKPAFQPVHAHVSKIFAYTVTPLRAAEVLMYAHAPSLIESA